MKMRRTGIAEMPLHYGHTDDLDIREGKTLVINPGETGGWLKERSTVVILDTDTMKPEVFDLE